MFLDIWYRITNWFFDRRKRLKAGPVPMASPVADSPAKLPVPVSEPPISLLERRRLKHDKFVVPEGELPIRPERSRLVTQEIEPKPKPKPPIDEDEKADRTDIGIVIAEPHHEDGEMVLFKAEEALGEFNFRDTILQQLDRYFFYLKRMKKHDADSYGFYRQVGATLLPYLATGSFHRTKEPDLEARTRPVGPLSPWFNETRPTFGCFAYGADPETEKFEQTEEPDKSKTWVPKFFYYQKCKVAPSTIQRIKGGGDIYLLTVWWDRPNKRFKHGIPQQLPIFISGDGKTITALKTLKTSWTSIRSPHGKFRVPERRWEIAKDYREWAKQHEEDVQHFLTSVFVDAVQNSENSHLSMARIAVTKRHMTAVFSVNIRRTAYFFQDRDIQVTQGGTRRPIFHLVRPHVRTDGTVVRMHFRGVRDFTWAGYKVHISVPGLDHIDYTDFNAGSITEEEVKVTGRKAFTMPQMGEIIAEDIRKGVGRQKRI